MSVDFVFLSLSDDYILPEQNSIARKVGQGCMNGFYYIPKLIKEAC